MPGVITVVEMATVVIGVRLAALVFLLSVCSHGHEGGAESKEQHPLYLLSMLPYPDPRFSVQPAIPHGNSTIRGVRLAIEHINNATGILNDYHIELIEGNGGCDLETLAMETLVRNVFHSGKQIVGIIGPGCSDSAVTVSDMCGREDISLITVHDGSTPLLADRDRFPYAFALSDTSFDDTKSAIELVRYNNWRSVAVLYDVSTLVYIDRYRLFEQEINSLADYEIAFSATVFNPDTPLNQLRKSFARIIVAFVGYESICNLVCLARHERLVYPSYQWLFVGNAISCFEDVSFTVLGRRYECTAAQQLVASEGMISIVSECYSGEFCWPDFDVVYEVAYNLQTCEEVSMYDGMWSLALALNSSIEVLVNNNMNLSGYQYGQDDITQTLKEQLYQVDFCGVTGQFRYDRNRGARNFSRRLYQFLDSNGINESLAGFHAGSQWNITNDAMFLPYQFSSTFIHVSEVAAAFSLLITAGTTVVIASAHLLTVVYRKYDSVKASSPRLNHFAYSGCYTILLTVSMYTLLESFRFGYELYSVVCNIAIWCISIGSTLILATVSVKTWRLYDIFVLSSRSLPSPSRFSDRRMVTVTLIMLSVDILLCLIWSSADPLVRKTTETLDLGDEPRIEVEYQCRSGSDISLAIAALLVLYKVSLLASSTCLAFLTRRIYIKIFETSNVTRLVYSICLVCGLGLPIYFITDETANRNVSFVILFLVLNTLVLLCFTFLFLPPLWPLLNRSVKLKPHQNSTGIVRSTHTRSTD